MDHIKTVLDRILEEMKRALTFEEGCTYCGISKSSMYKHTSNNNIPHYKPEGKLIYFKREELDEWMLRNKQSSSEELERVAAKYSFKNKNSNLKSSK